MGKDGVRQVKTLDQKPDELVVGLGDQDRPGARLLQDFFTHFEHAARRVGTPLQALEKTDPDI